MNRPELSLPLVSSLIAAMANKRLALHWILVVPTKPPRGFAAAAAFLIGVTDDYSCAREFGQMSRQPQTGAIDKPSGLCLH